MITGLTGQSGSGKSTVSSIFAAGGYYVIDADSISREVTSKGSPALSEIEEAFGSGVIDDEGCLKRRALGDIVFGDRERLDTLEGILYPHIVARIKELAYEHSAAGEDVLIDAPTLFQAGADSICDVIVSVTADEGLRLSRITARDGITEKQARERFASQYDEEFFLSHSDYVIRNDGTEEELRAHVLSVMNSIKDMRGTAKNDA